MHIRAQGRQAQLLFDLMDSLLPVRLCLLVLLVLHQQWPDLPVR